MNWDLLNFFRLNDLFSIISQLFFVPSIIHPSKIDLAVFLTTSMFFQTTTSKKRRSYHQF